jgi:hypothetical protein
VQELEGNEKMRAWILIAKTDRLNPPPWARRVQGADIVKETMEN